MKYKKHITTGALALSLLLGGSTAFAQTPQDKTNRSGLTNFEVKLHQKVKHVGRKKQKNNHEVGIITALTATGFTLEIKNLKTNEATSVDVRTTSTTVYRKDGAISTAADLAPGQKVIVKGDIDPTSHVITATKINSVTKIPKTGFHPYKKVSKKNINQ